MTYGAENWVTNEKTREIKRTEKINENNGTSKTYSDERDRFKMDMLEDKNLWTVSVNTFGYNPK